MHQLVAAGGTSTVLGMSDRPSPPMSLGKWQKLQSSEITPGFISWGSPPDPVDTDVYADRWSKLVWMEFRASVHDFLRELYHPRSQRFSFAQTAQLTVSVDSEEDIKGLRGISIRGVDASNDFALPEETNHPADFVRGLLKLPQGQGWIYIESLVFPDDAAVHTGPVLGKARFYDEGFLKVPSDRVCDMHRARDGTPCILFTNFNTCYNRFEVLQKYPSVCSDLRAAIEGAEHRAHAGNWLLPLTGGAHRSKLNSKQVDIMRDLQGPLDFVQGPPGTGKSTFIVELLRARIPCGAKVLLCTTTNNAIDSLTEKIHAGGGNDVVAFGNPKRLGHTSLKLTLEQQYLRHPAAAPALRLYELCKKTNTKWTQQLEQLNKLEEGSEASARNRGTSVRSHEVAVARKKQQMLQEAESYMLLLKPAMDELINSQEQPESVKKFLQERTTRLRATLGAIWEHPRTPEEFTGWLAKVSDFARASNFKMKFSIKLHIVRNARYFVCTADSAVRLQRKIENEVFPSKREGRDLQDTAASRPAGHGLVESASAAVKSLAARLGSTLLQGQGGGQRRAALGGRPKATSDDADERAELREILTFKYVVLDEAGAMLEPDMLGTIIHGCRFLLCVGDHKQLPPFTRWKEAEAHRYSVSLLQRLVERPAVPPGYHLMTVQYRMHPSIATLVSDTFYGGMLVTADCVARARLRSTPVIFCDVRDGKEQKSGTSWKNVQEARLIVETVMTEVEKLQSQKRSINIDVLTFHKPQMFLVKDMVKQAGLLQEGSVEVMTVDSMQGREADIIVLSCVRSGDRRSIGFLRSPNRLNVALSRAREQLYIVGHMDGLDSFGTPDWINVLRHEHLSCSSGFRGRC